MDRSAPAGRCDGRTLSGAAAASVGAQRRSEGLRDHEGARRGACLTAAAAVEGWWEQAGGGGRSVGVVWCGVVWSVDGVGTGKRQGG